MLILFLFFRFSRSLSRSQSPLLLLLQKLYKPNGIFCIAMIIATEFLICLSGVVSLWLSHTILLRALCVLSAYFECQIRFLDSLGVLKRSTIVPNYAHTDPTTTTTKLVGRVKAKKWIERIYHIIFNVHVCVLLLPLRFPFYPALILARVLRLLFVGGVVVAVVRKRVLYAETYKI